MQLSKRAKIIYLSATLFGLFPTASIAQPIEQIKETKSILEVQEQSQFSQLNNQLKVIAKKIQQIKEQSMQRQLEIQQQEEINQKKQELEYFINQMSSINNVMKMDLTTVSGLTAEKADQVLEGTGLADLGKDFVEAEEEYGVNAVYLMAHAAWESGWGTSNISKLKNNLYGFQAYDNSPAKSATKFNSKGECIKAVAKYVSEHYLNENGDHYNGPHLKGMNIKYATDKNWAEGISEVMISLVNKQHNRDPI